MSDGINAGVVEMDGWRVIAVEGKGIYIAGEGDPWLIAAHDQLEQRDDELSQKYFEAIDE